MSWVKLDDRFLLNPKIMQAGLEARALYVAALCYCAGELTDGFIARNVAYKIAALADVEHTDAAITRLVELRLWEVVDGGWRVQYVRCRITHEDDSPARRAWDLLRSDVAPKIYERDGYQCRYCGGVLDLTIDHVVPISRGGSNDPDNLAVACRSCNSSKHAKLLEVWRS